jgi:hypothetical protein
VRNKVGFSVFNELLEKNSSLLGETKKNPDTTIEQQSHLNVENSIQPPAQPPQSCYRVGDMLINVEQEVKYMYPADGVIIQILNDVSAHTDRGIRR